MPTTPNSRNIAAAKWRLCAIVQRVASIAGAPVIWPADVIRNAALRTPPTAADAAPSRARGEGEEEGEGTGGRDYDTTLLLVNDLSLEKSHIRPLPGSYGAH